MHTITYVHTSSNRSLVPRPKSGFWAITDIFSDGARLVDGFFGRDRYGLSPKERIDWFDSYLDGEKWFKNNGEKK